MTKSLPEVWEYAPKNLITKTIGLEGEKQYALHSVLPSDPEGWNTFILTLPVKSRQRESQ